VEESRTIEVASLAPISAFRNAINERLTNDHGNKILTECKNKPQKEKCKRLKLSFNNKSLLKKHEFSA